MPPTRKRKRAIEQAEAESQPRESKRQKPLSSTSRSKTPPEFWDNLSRVPLCRRALREFNRRTVQPVASTQPAERAIESHLVKQLKRFARRDGPDLRNIRGYPEQNDMTSRGSASRSSRTGTGSGSRPRRTPGTTISYKDPAFEQALIDNGIYPYNRGPKPKNWEEMQERLAQPRPSLSPSQFSDGHFEQFQLKNEEADSESAVKSNVFPLIRGRETVPYGQDHCFNHLEPLAPNISDPKPDYYNGSRPSQINSDVRNDLGPYIVPCNNQHRPALTYFFTEAKGPDGKASEVKRQITQDLAAGARGMLKMQSYELDEPVYDGNAQTFGSTYHSGTGTLQLYAMHPTAPAGPDAEPEYHTTQITAFALTANPKTYQQGIGAWRNLRDLAKERREEFIARANEIADDGHDGPKAATEAYLTSFSASLSTQNELFGSDSLHEESETSMDELAEIAPPTKRTRAHQPSRKKQTMKSFKLSHFVVSSDDE